MKFTGALLLVWTTKVSSALEIDSSRAASIYGWLNDVDPSPSAPQYEDYDDFADEDDLQGYYKGE